METIFFQTKTVSSKRRIATSRSNFRNFTKSLKRNRTVSWRFNRRKKMSSMIWGDYIVCVVVIVVFVVVVVVVVIAVVVVVIVVVVVVVVVTIVAEKLKKKQDSFLKIQQEKENVFNDLRWLRCSCCCCRRCRYCCCCRCCHWCCAVVVVVVVVVVVSEKLKKKQDSFLKIHQEKENLFNDLRCTF